MAWIASTLDWILIGDVTLTSISIASITPFALSLPCTSTFTPLASTAVAGETFALLASSSEAYARKKSTR